MREFDATLNLNFNAHDEDEAAEIVEACKRAIAEYERQPYKVNVEADKLES